MADNRGQATCLSSNMPVVPLLFHRPQAALATRHMPLAISRRDHVAESNMLRKLGLSRLRFSQQFLV